MNITNFFPRFGRRHRPRGWSSPVDLDMRVPTHQRPWRQGRTGDAAFEADLGIQRRDDVTEQLGLNPRPVYRPPGYRR